MDLQGKGIRLDNSATANPNKSWLWAKNILISNGYQEIKNEDGFDKWLDVQDYLAAGYEIIGTIPTSDVLVVLLTNNTNFVILKVTEAGTVTTVVNSTGFAFTKSNYIVGCYKYLANGNLVIAFTDNTTNPFLLNLNSLPFDVDGAYQVVATTYHSIAQNIAKGYLFPQLEFPYLTASVDYDRSGSIEEGAYAFGIAYKISSYDITVYSPVSNIVHVTSISEDLNILKTRTLYKAPKYSNSEAGDKVPAAIKIDILDTTGGVNHRLDDRYDQFILYGIVKTEATWSAFHVGTYNIADFVASNDLIYYDGSVETILDINEISIPGITFNKCADLKTVDDRLIAPNITYNTFNYTVLQQDAIKQRGFKRIIKP